jgi:hypothetical protein
MSNGAAPSVQIEVNAQSALEFPDRGNDWVDVTYKTGTRHRHECLDSAMWE